MIRDVFDLQAIKRLSASSQYDLLAETMKKRKESELESKNLIKFRFGTIKSYYRRLSWCNKVIYLTNLIKAIYSVEILEEIFHLIYPLYDKVTVYTMAIPNPGYRNNNILLDHNRTVAPLTLEITMDEDLEWFSHLKAEQQFSMIKTLIERTGGNIIGKLYLPVKHLFSQKLRRSKVELQCPVPDFPLNLKDDDESDYDPKNPASIEVEKRRKHWNDIITAYSDEIDEESGIVKQPSDEEEKRKSARKPKADKKSKKSGKITNEDKSKKSKQSKKNVEKKGLKKDKSTGLDWIQLLPVWNVKQIFNYLDQKTLNVAKNVNAYWAYIVQDLKKDQKAQQQFHKTLEKLKEGITPKIYEQFKKAQQPPKYIVRRRLLNYRMNRLMDRGAILNKLRPRFNAKHNEWPCSNCLLTLAPIQTDNEYITPIEKISIFPRVRQDTKTVYKSKAACLKDINVLSDTHTQVLTISQGQDEFSDNTFSVEVEAIDKSDW